MLIDVAASSVNNVRPAFSLHRPIPARQCGRKVSGLDPTEPGYAELQSRIETRLRVGSR